MSIIIFQVVYRHRRQREACFLLKTFSKCYYSSFMTRSLLKRTVLLLEGLSPFSCYYYLFRRMLRDATLSFWPATSSASRLFLELHMERRRSAASAAAAKLARSVDVHLSFHLPLPASVSLRTGQRKRPQSAAWIKHELAACCLFSAAELYHGQLCCCHLAT